MTDLSILNKTLDASAFVTTLPTETTNEIDINLINPNPYQPRFDEVKEELTASIKAAYESAWLSHNADDSLVKPEDGLLQPITITADPNEDGYFIVTDGHCRLNSCKKLEHKTIKYNLVKTTDKQLELFALVGNLQRVDLSPFETALAVDRLLKSGYYDSAGDLAKALGKSPSWLSKCRSVLKLNDEILADMRVNKIKIGLELLVDLQRLDCEVMQEELYNKYKDDEITQADIRAAIKKQKEDVPTQILKPLIKSSNKSLNFDFAWDNIEEKRRDKFEEDFRTLLDNLLDKYDTSAKDNISYIDVLSNNKVYIEYEDNDSINVSYSKAKELISNNFNHLIRYNCAEDEAAMNFINDIPNRRQWHNDSISYLELKD